MRIAELKRRVDALEQTVRPEDSLVSRLEELSPVDLDTYNKWVIERKIWNRRFKKPEGAYEAYLHGESGPKLSKSVSEKLYGPEIKICIDDDAKEIYARYIEGKK